MSGSGERGGLFHLLHELKRIKVVESSLLFNTPSHLTQFNLTPLGLVTWYLIAEEGQRQLKRRRAFDCLNKISQKLSIQT
jgi:hypothetical protein